jgi:PA domain-containing protein
VRPAGVTRIRLGGLALAGLLVSAAIADAGPAQFVIVNANAPGVGLNDPTPAAPIGGNTGTTLGQQRLIALEHAAAIWGARLESSVPIRVYTQFAPLGTGIVGSASPGWIYRDFPNAPLPGVFYPSALANKFAGVDVDTTPGEFGDDMAVTLSTEFDFYLGLDNDAGPRIDLVTILLHEVGHGLGVVSWAGISDGRDAYSRYLLDTTLGLTWSEMTGAQRAESSTRWRGLVWNGERVTTALPAVLSYGTPTLAVTSPAALARAYEYKAAYFGPRIGAPDVAGPIVEVTACSPIADPGSVAGRIVLVERSSCSFALQARYASDAGAAAALIYNFAAGNGVMYVTDDGINGAFVTIPVLGLARVDGLAIRAQLATGVSANLFIDGTLRAGSDASGRALLYAPRPIEFGSSISHYDGVASRNLLMEPAFNPDLTHSVKAPYDLTAELLYDLGWTFPDADGDGVADDEDCATVSDARPTIFVGTLDSGVKNLRLEGGCMAADLIAQLRTVATNRGSFLSPLAHLTNEWVANGTYTEEQKGAIQSTAARAR